MTTSTFDIYRPMPEHRVITQEAYPFLLGTFLLFLLGLFAGWIALTICALLAFVFVAFFFRNPTRIIPQTADVVVAPADGRVLGIKYNVETPLTKKPATVISIFMSVLNGHINRLPIAGEIKKVFYQPGKFFVASLEKAMEHNEQNSLLVVDEQGREVLMTQVAGLVARRIVCYMTEGMQGKRGQRCGLIRFGSRVDIYLPTTTNIFVKKGERVYSGVSILGKFT